MRILPWLCYILCSVLSDPYACANGPEQILQLARDSNQTSVESVQTFSCKYSIDSIYGKLQCEYWRSGASTRLRWTSGQNLVDSIVSNGRVHTKSTTQNLVGAKPAFRGSIAIDEGKPFTWSDPWDLGMFLFSGDGKTPPFTRSFISLFQLKHQIIRAERIEENGKELYLIEVEFVPKYRNMYWLDPSVNFLIKRMKLIEPDSRTTIREVLSFKAGGNGIFFPEIVENRVMFKGELKGTETIRYTDIQINQPMNPTIFQMDFPPGTEVHDFIQQKKFIVDAKGEINSSTGKPLPPPPLPIGATQPANPLTGAPEITARTETSVEPRHDFRWLIYLAFGLLSSAWFVAYRKRRSSLEK